MLGNDTNACCAIQAVSGDHREADRVLFLLAAALWLSVSWLPAVPSGWSGVAPAGGEFPESRTATAFAASACADREQMDGLHCVSALALDSEEEYMVQLINNYRQQQGKQILSVSPTLSAAAEWMANDTWGCYRYDCGYDCLHSDSENRCITERVQAFGYPGDWATEVLYAGSESAESALSWWQSSASHNGQILRDDILAVGVGRAYAPPSAGNVWVWVANLGPVADTADLPGDLNKDRVVDIFDLVIVGSSFGKSPGDSGYDPRADANRSGGSIDILDLVLVGSHFGDTA